MLGMFDSGFGGLHVLQGIRRDLPNYEYVFLADSARAPYGPHLHDDIYQWTKQGVEFLFSHGAKLVILACNTASSESLRRLQSDYQNEPHKKVLGVLIPFAEEAAATTVNGRVGIIATEGTVRSAAFEREIQKVNPSIRVFQRACPLLVPMIEAGQQNSAAMKDLLTEYIEPLLKEDIDTLVLGCTHYGIIEEAIRAAAGGHIRLISETDILSRKISEYFVRHPDYEPAQKNPGTVGFFTTGDVARFEELGCVFFGEPIHAEHAVLSE
jgi:glutamate racemase